MGCTCDPPTRGGHEFVDWIGQVFRDCVYTPLDQLAFFLGLLNIVLWMVAQIPQFVTNYREKRAEALAFWFLASWLMGDVSNLMGAVLTRQLPTVVYTAVYFCLMDVFMVSSWYYYTHVYPKRVPHELKEPIVPHGSANEEAYTSGSYWGERLYVVSLLACGVFVMRGFAHVSFRTEDGSGIHLGRTLFQEDLCDSVESPEGARRIVGDIMAWLSGVLYVGARFPQLFLNHKRRSVEGLSMAMFILAISANSSYGLSILLRPLKSDFWENTFPYLLGSLGTIAMDLITLAQFHYYRRVAKPLFPEVVVIDVPHPTPVN